MKTRITLKSIILLCALIVGSVSEAWAEDVTVTLTQSSLGLTGSYTTGTEKTISGIKYEYTDLMKNGDNIQAKASSGEIFNKTAFPEDIKSVVVTHTLTARTTIISGSANGKDWTQVTSGSGSVTSDFSGKGYKYFKITRGSNAAYWTKIEISYTPSSSIPTHTATFSVNGTTTTTDYKEGDAITFPANPEAIYGKVFMGWVTTHISGTTNTAPNFVTSATMGQSDVTYYAVFADVTAGTEGDASLTIDAAENSEGFPSQYWGTKDYTLSGKVFNITQAYKNGTKLQWRADGNSNGTGTIYNKDALTKIQSIVLTYDASDIYKNFNVKIGDSANPASGTAITPDISGSVYTFDCSTLNKSYFVLTNGTNAGYLASIVINYKSGTPDTYSDYCTTVVAATVARPEIVVAENPFLFSTTAEITCDTQGATIKYSYDGETWNDYEGELTITETKTIYAKAVKGSDESSVASVTATKNLAETAVSIDYSGITNTDVYTGTAAGSLSATVTYNDAAIEGATVAWSGNNNAVATIDEQTGVVTLVAAGSVTFMATYAGNSDYAEATATYMMIVTNSDPNVPGTENNPYTVAQALENTPSSGNSTDVYVSGIVSGFYGSVDDILDDSYSHRYYISDDGLSTSDQLLVYNGKGLNNVAFSSASDVMVGDRVVIKGQLTKYNSTKELAAGNYIVSLDRPLLQVATPVFSAPSQAVVSGAQISISCTTTGATIYYTTDGTDPTENSTEYVEPITINEDVTIKAIAVKEGMVDSEVAEATYTINSDPVLAVDPYTTSDIRYEGTTGSLSVVAHNFELNSVTEAEFEFFEGVEPTEAPDWLELSVSDDYSTINYTVDANTGDARTATFKLVLTFDNTESVWSDMITISQAAYVKDFADLPFEYDGDGTGELPTGFTVSGLGTYSSSPAMKFDNSDDYAILKINERPGTLTFDIKGNSFSSSTFKVQTSEDGTTYTDLATYTELGDLQNEKFKNLDEGVRYIKWVYAQKASGNVALGNINLAKYVEPDPSITVEPDEVEVDAAQHNGTLAISYQKLDITSKDDFSIQFYDSDANALADVPDWLEVLIAQEQSGAYVVSYSIGENSGDERTAYFEVYALNEQVPVYSNTVTITQAAYAVSATYTLATTITSGKHYIITNGIDKAMAADKGNNRDAVDIDINGETITITSDDGVYEVAIYGPYTIGEQEFYTIYDETPGKGGYLYAQGGTSNNYLKTGQTLENKGQWKISFDPSSGKATIVANVSGRNVMRYNSGNSLFSCYASGQADVYLYEKTGDNGSGTTEVSIASACTDGTKCYGTYSSSESFVAPADVTVSEIRIDAEGKLRLHDYETGSLIPAKTGVLVSSTTGGSKTLTLATGGSSVLGAANRLRPTGAGITAEAMAAADEGCKFFRLTMHNGTDLGFWWGAAEGAAFAVAANKAYLAVPATTTVRSGYTWQDVVTGIDATLNSTESDKVIYDLQGRRVSKPTKGLYLVNGKKVVVK